MPSVSGYLNPPPENRRAAWAAAAPAERRTSFSGSLLPYASELQAFDTPLHGETGVDRDGRFVIDLPDVPNSYHDGGGHPLPPQVVLRWAAEGRLHERAFSVPSARHPYRSLTPSCSQVRQSAAFDEVQTQEAYLRADAWKPRDDRFVA